MLKVLLRTTFSLNAIAVVKFCLYKSQNKYINTCYFRSY